MITPNPLMREGKMIDEEEWKDTLEGPAYAAETEKPPRRDLILQLLGGIFLIIASLFCLPYLDEIHCSREADVCTTESTFLWSIDMGSGAQFAPSLYNGATHQTTLDGTDDDYNPYYIALTTPRRTERIEAFSSVNGYAVKRYAKRLSAYLRSKKESFSMKESYTWYMALLFVLLLWYGAYLIYKTMKGEVDYDY